MPRPSSRFSLRSKTDLRFTFFSCFRAQQLATRQLNDRRTWALVQVLRERDAAASMRRELDRKPALPLAHRLELATHHGHATLLHATARYGRLACARLLLQRGDEGQRGDQGLHSCKGSSGNELLEALDGGGFTPLMMAAWCGHLSLVNLFLAHSSPLSPKGVPPMTSACGGKGPFDAETWAERKGFSRVARAIRDAGSVPVRAARGHGDSAQAAAEKGDAVDHDVRMR